MTKTIIITGISGSGTKEFCKNYSKQCSKKTRVYHTGDMIEQLAQGSIRGAPIRLENLLNLHPEKLNSLRQRAFERILNNLEKDRKNYERIVIDTHAQFFWNDVFENAYDWKYLNHLSADMFISLIDKPSIIRNNQLKSEQGRLQSHDLRDILLWQNIEVNITQGWALKFKKPMYVIPHRQDPSTIESLLQNAYLIYFQMPMTEADGEADKKITQFKEKLLSVGKGINGLPTPLIDPRDIDIEDGKGLSERTTKAIRIQTLHRDLDWYIPQATDLIAFYPPGTNISKGVSDESTRGFETGKNAFVIFPKKETSPFMDISKRVFTSEEEFFEFFPDYLRKAFIRYKRK